MASDYYSPPEVVSVMGLVDTYLRWGNANQPPRGFEKYHPSAFGKCLRQMQYDRYVERGYMEKNAEDTKPFMLRIWGTGHSMHDRWRQYFEDIGVLRGYWECSNAVCPCYNDEGVRIHEDSYVWDAERRPRTRFYGKDELQGVFKPSRCICGSDQFKYHEVDVVSKEMNFYGHCDAILDFSRFDGSKYMSVVQSYMMDYLPTKPIVVDFKTINMFDFQDVDKGAPHDYYITQLTIYANILQCDFGILLYENKNNSQTCSFRVDKNPPLFEKIREQASEMNNMVEVEEDGVVHHLLPPPRPKNKEDKDCKYCAYRETCHSSAIWDDPELDVKRSEFYEVGYKRPPQKPEDGALVPA